MNKQRVAVTGSEVHDFPGKPVYCMAPVHAGSIDLLVVYTVWATKDNSSSSDLGNGGRNGTANDYVPHGNLGPAHSVYMPH